MANQSMLDFLMEHDIDLVCLITKKVMSADCLFELGGEFVVYKNHDSQTELYRGDDFDKAVAIMERWLD
jgi:hypothetical protein